jgi:hypothetical protein
MITIILSICAVAIVVTLTVLAISWYMSRNNKSKEEAMKPALVRSKYFSDDFYVGKTVKLDSTLRLTLKGTIIQFPESNLTIKEFKYFKFRDNEFEETHFEAVNGTEYKMLYDVSQKNLFFLAFLSLEDSGKNDPRIIADGPLVLEENGSKYEYNDFSGLIELLGQSSDYRSITKLCRVYNRVLSEEDDEYIVAEINEPNKVSYWVGFCLVPNQLENI